MKVWLDLRRRLQPKVGSDFCLLIAPTPLEATSTQAAAWIRRAVL
jgi:hypothetical protein